LKSIHAQVIAFSSILQSLQAVEELANKGTCNTFTLETCLESLLHTEVDNIDLLYPNLSGLKPGLILLNHQMSESFSKSDMQIAQYLAAILHLSKKIKKFPEFTQVIQKGIEQAINLKEDYPVTHENMQARLAGIYTDSISKISPQIMIKGDPGILNNPSTVNKIRALLLSALRNALLWQQFGGSKWTLLFSRKKYFLDVQGKLKQL